MASFSSSGLRLLTCFCRQRTSLLLSRRLSSTGLLSPIASPHSDRCLRLACSATPFQRSFSTAVPCPEKETVSISFKFPDGTYKKAKAKVGETLLDAVLQSHLDIDGYGACEGTLACSTCHLIFSPENYAKLSAKPTDEELDMLDLAYGLSDTSRLGCQVVVSKEMDGWEVLVPGGIADARA